MSTDSCDEDASYFMETSPDQWNYIDYYRYRLASLDFTNSFRKEAFKLKKCLEALTRSNCPEVRKNAELLLSKLKNHRKNIRGVNDLWYKIEQQYLENMSKIRSLRCRVTIKGKTQEMMEGLAEETVTESRATPVKRKHSEVFDLGEIEDQEHAEPEVQEECVDFGSDDSSVGPEEEQNAEAEALGKVQHQEIIISEQQVVDNGDDGTQQESDLSKELSESFVVHGVNIIATLKERQKLGIYEAVYYDILDLSERTVKTMFQSNVWTALKKEMYLTPCMPSDEVKTWLKKLDTEVINNVEAKLLLLSTAILQQPPSLQLKFVLRVYENFVDLWRQNPNPLLDFNMSEDTQLVLVIAPILRHLFGNRYLIKFGETGLQASSFRRNQTPDTTSRRKMGQRTDVIVALRSHQEQEFVVCELSGSPYAKELDHFGDDKLKIQKGLKDILNLIAIRYKHGNVEHFKKIKVFGLQVFGWKVHVYTMDLQYKALYRFAEVMIINIPRMLEESTWITPMVCAFLSLKKWVDESVKALEELANSVMQNSTELSESPPTSPITMISVTKPTPEKPQKFKQVALP